MTDFRSVGLALTRPARRAYRYLTGDPSCLGYVRTACLAVALFDGASAIAFARTGNFKDTGAAMLMTVLVLVLVGPSLFKEAAATDRSPIGPAPTVTETAPGFYSLLTVFILAGATYQLVRYFNAGSLLDTPAAYAYVCALWGPTDRDGGQGERTLSKDLHRLFRRSGPEIAGGHVSRSSLRTARPGLVVVPQRVGLAVHE